jgi:hypothetical protein
MNAKAYPVPVGQVVAVAFLAGTHGPAVPDGFGLVTVTVQVSVAVSHQELHEAPASAPAVGQATADEDHVAETGVADGVPHSDQDSSIGHSVVETATTEVTTLIDSSGQLVISGGQLQMVEVWVS